MDAKLEHLAKQEELKDKLFPRSKVNLPSAQKLTSRASPEDSPVQKTSSRPHSLRQLSRDDESKIFQIEQTQNQHQLESSRLTSRRDSGGDQQVINVQENFDDSGKGKLDYNYYELWREKHGLGHHQHHQTHNKSSFVDEFAKSNNAFKENDLSSKMPVSLAITCSKIINTKQRSETIASEMTVSMMSSMYNLFQVIKR